MKRNGPNLLPIPVDGKLKSLIEAAADQTGLSQADVMRSALKIGVPQVVQGLRVRKHPRRNLVEYLDAFVGLIEPSREIVLPPRLK
jgi:hypothetical protein